MAGFDLDPGSELCLNRTFGSFLLLVTSTFMAPRRSSRLSFPLLATLALTCWLGVTWSCSVLTSSSCCVELAEFPDSTSWLAATLLPLFWSLSTLASVEPGCLLTFVFSSWSNEATLFVLSQQRAELVLRGLPPPLLANLWEATNKSDYPKKSNENSRPGSEYRWKSLFTLCRCWMSINWTELALVFTRKVLHRCSPFTIYINTYVCSLFHVQASQYSPCTDTAGF